MMPTSTKSAVTMCANGVKPGMLFTTPEGAYRVLEVRPLRSDWGPDQILHIQVETVAGMTYGGFVRMKTELVHVVVTSTNP